ncbi:SDR family NAD(P)-dependent oxidoreductase [Rivibacter subsaxonicus]|uniref:Short-subunit dehydrogenase n=1 Tax=Rivibacter subsaxonicus TaxID=457575 RepID=A0A4Q7VVN9_9BURK|nr:SDR family NAD(P)-dependent oxidoreductase [Rivibacter subsaxonicus]RZU00653.1 short-subunit dehydrogenase [Rivibacter subsaxonicus]
MGKPNPKLDDWRGRHAWLVGASTGIGRATASALHARGARVIVSARGREALESFVQAHPGAQAVALDATDHGSMLAAAAQVRSLLERQPGARLDLAMYCAGHYKAQRATEFDLDEMLCHQQINYVGALHLIDAVLPLLRAQGGGHLSLVASVAGYRGLPNALAYGPTKAALINLAQTLYLDLHEMGLGVSLINPGFVATPLTAQNAFRMPALLTPEQAAREILAGWAAGDFEIHFPKRFTRTLKALGLLGDGLYFKAIRRATGS